METKFYKRKFITSGITGYDDTGEGNLLIQKLAIDKALTSLIKKPVIIGHDGNEQVGEIVDAYFLPEQDVFICGFNIWNKEAIDLLDNKGYGISCTYNILKENKDGGIYHNIPYSSEAEAIDFTNIAIVENPRYEEAREIINSVVENGGLGSGRKGHTTPKPVVIDSRRRFKDYKALSDSARKFYKENIQGKTIDKELIGKINFLQSGIKETISKGNPNYIFKIKDIIKTGKVKKPEPIYKERKDEALYFDRIKNTVKYKNQIKDVLVKIRNRKDGIKDFYLIRDDNKKERLTSSKNKA